MGTYTVTIAAPVAGPGSTIQIVASGQSGEENIALLIDDELVATFGSIAVAGETLSYQSDEAGITANRVKVAFINDLYDPNTGVDRNVTIESVAINGTTYLTDEPSVFSTGSWQPLDGVVPGFGRGDILHTDGFFAYGQAPEQGSILTIDAAGATGFETMELLIDGAVVATFENVTDALTTYTYQAETTVLADQVRVQFTNDVYDPANGIDYNLFVERITIDDRVFQTDDPSVFSTGTWLPADGTQPGFGRGDTLTSNGYFQYQEAPPPDGSVIEIYAAGAEGAETMELFIDGALKARFEDIPVLGDTFVFQSDEVITADQVRVAFVNDVYDPTNGIDYNLTVDKISIDTLVFETENPNVFSTGTWLPEDGTQPGFGRGETLTNNGYFQYSSLGADDFPDV